MKQTLTPELKAYYAKEWVKDLQSKDAAKRKYAAEEIGRQVFDDDSVIRALIDLANNDENHYVKTAAQNALQNFPRDLANRIAQTPEEARPKSDTSQ